MATIITAPVEEQHYATLHGTTRDPDHEWKIEMKGDHCYLYVDGKFVLHNTMEKCTSYLANL